MPHFIGTKLDFLMKLTGTANTTLGRAINFDPSYISRIRSNQRGLPQKQPFSQLVAAYFARNLTTPYQQVSAAQAVCPGEPWPANQEKAAALLAGWLEQENETPAVLQSQSAKEEQTCFIGSEGKREAANRFLDRVLEQNPLPPLLLHTDESFSWVYEDSGFARQWGEKMALYLSRGGKITVIHSVGRKFEDMMEGLKRWIPLYLLGAVDPWYCPRRRDGIFFHTLFIAQGHSAITSRSVQDHTEGMVNFYIDNRKAVRALEREFRQFQELCRPLMKVCRHGEGGKLAEELARTHSGDAAWPALDGYALPDAQSGSHILCGETEALVFGAEMDMVFLIRETDLLSSIRDTLQPSSPAERAKAVARLNEYLSAH